MIKKLALTCPSRFQKKMPCTHCIPHSINKEVKQDNNGFSNNCLGKHELNNIEWSVVKSTWKNIFVFCSTGISDLASKNTVATFPRKMTYLSSSCHCCRRNRICKHPNCEKSPFFRQISFEWPLSCNKI